MMRWSRLASLQSWIQGIRRNGYSAVSLERQRANFAAAIESQTRSLEINESLLALNEREQCERRIGKMDEADADRRRIRELAPEQK